MSASPEAESRVAALSQAFALFNDTSRALTESYQELQRRAADLSRQLAAAHDARLRELAAKERLAERMQALIEVLPGAVLVLDAEARVLEANAVARELFPGLVIGCTWSTLAASRFAHAEGSLCLADGRRFSLSEQRLGDGSTIILLSDVTRISAMQAQLDHHQRLSALGEMSARLAHQLRTPLSAAMLYASRLLDTNLAANMGVRLGERILERLRHLDHLIADMLRYARAQHDGGEKVSVADLLRRVSRLRGEAHERIRLRIRDDSQGAILAGNADLLASAIDNLLDNCERFSPVDGEIRLHLRCQGSWLWITVSDQGPGVPAGDRLRVFDPFYTTRTDGTGLGLAVVRSVVAAHGGEVSVGDAEGGGAEFRLRLPLATRDADLAGGVCLRRTSELTQEVV